MLNADQLEADVESEYRQKLSIAPPAGRYVLVLGHSSSGKTTTAQAAARRQGWRYVYDSALLGGGRFADYTRILFQENDNTALLPYEVEALLVRFLQNRHAGPDCICDQGIHSIWAYARARHTLGDLSDHIYQTIYALFLTLAAESPTPRLVLRFRCDAAEARRRVEGRGRPHEATSLTTEFIAELDSAYERVIAKFPSHVRTEKIDTTGLDKAEVLERFIALIDAHSAQ